MLFVSVYGIVIVPFWKKKKGFRKLLKSYFLSWWSFHSKNQKGLWNTTAKVTRYGLDLIVVGLGLTFWHWSFSAVTSNPSSAQRFALIKSRWWQSCMRSLDIALLSWGISKTASMTLCLRWTYLWAVLLVQHSHQWGGRKLFLIREGSSYSIRWSTLFSRDRQWPCWRTWLV